MTLWMSVCGKAVKESNSVMTASDGTPSASGIERCNSLVCANKDVCTSIHRVSKTRFIFMMLNWGMLVFY